MIRLFTITLSTLVLGVAAPAWANADCPSPYDTLSCNSVCYYSSGEVYCSGVQGHDTFILIEDNQGDPHIYGTRDGGLSPYDFCCNSSDLGSITGAVTANIDTGSGNTSRTARTRPAGTPAPVARGTGLRIADRLVREEPCGPRSTRSEAA